MTPEQAINIIDQAVAQIQANREVHVKLQEAIQILNNLIKKE